MPGGTPRTRAEYPCSAKLASGASCGNASEPGSELCSYHQLHDAGIPRPRVRCEDCGRSTRVEISERERAKVLALLLEQLRSEDIATLEEEHRGRLRVNARRLIFILEEEVLV